MCAQGHSMPHVDPRAADDATIPTSALREPEHLSFIGTPRQLQADSGFGLTPTRSVNGWRGSCHCKGCGGWGRLGCLRKAAAHAEAARLKRSQNSLEGARIQRPIRGAWTSAELAEQLLGSFTEQLEAACRDREDAL